MAYATRADYDVKSSAPDFFSQEEEFDHTSQLHCSQISKANADSDWRLTRVALEQAALLLTTPEACDLASTCRILKDFIEKASGEFAYWDDCQAVRGIYSQSLSWLHPVTSLHQARRFAALAQQLRLRGSTTFARPGEFKVLLQLLQEEKSLKEKIGTGKEMDRNPTRFLVPWCLNPEIVANLAEGNSQAVVTESARFKFKYGLSLSFTLTLSGTPPCSDESVGDGVTVRLSPADIDECLNGFEVKVSCAIVSSELEGSIVTLLPIERIQHVNKVHTKDQKFTQLLKLISVVVPTWLELGECKVNPMHWKERAAQRSSCVIC
jgi:hypothetical protein